MKYIIFVLSIIVTMIEGINQCGLRATCSHKIDLVPENFENLSEFPSGINHDDGIVFTFENQYGQLMGPGIVDSLTFIKNDIQQRMYLSRPFYFEFMSSIFSGSGVLVIAVPDDATYTIDLSNGDVDDLIGEALIRWKLTDDIWFRSGIAEDKNVVVYMNNAQELERQTINGDNDRFNLIEIIEQPLFVLSHSVPLKASKSLDVFDPLVPSSSIISASIAVPSALSTLLSMPSKQPVSVSCLKAQNCVSSSNYSKSNIISRYPTNEISHPTIVVEDAMMKPDHYLFPENLHEVMTSLLPIVITEIHTPYRIVKVNKAWEQLCGFFESEVIGKTMRILQGKKTQKNRLNYLSNRIYTELDYYKSAADERPDHANLSNYYRAITINLTNYKKSGAPFENKLSVAPFNFDGEVEVTHLIGILQPLKFETTYLEEI